jgi:hypothetical protein
MLRKLLSTFAVVALTLVIASSASALTVDQLKALGLTDAQAQAVAAIFAGSTPVVSTTFTRDLTIGSTGSDVVALQDMLVSGGYLVMPVGVSKGYFGALTQSALGKYQAANGISPAAGYFGPITRSKVNASVVVTPPAVDDSDDTSSGSTKLQGGAGSIDEAKFIGSINNEEVGEGQEDVEVMGLAIKPENSDINLTAVKLVFTKANSTGSTRLNKYVDEVSVMLDGKEIARRDASDFKRDSTLVYSSTLSLDKAVIRDGDVGELTVAVSAVSNIDSVDAGKVWGVKVDNVRFEDAQGAIITENSQGDIGTNRNFTVEEFSTASNIKFKLMSGDSSINNSRTIEVSSTTRVSNEAVLSFKVKIEGSSDVNVDEIVIGATTTNTTLQNVISTAYLFIDGKRVSSESINAASSVIVFDNLDLDLDGGKTYNVEVRVDFQRATGAFVSGTTITANASTTADWIIEDQNGDNVASGDRSGGVTAQAHKLVTEGLQISRSQIEAKAITVGTTASTTYGNYEVEVSLTAIGETLYVLETAASSSVASTTAGISYVFEDSSGNQIGTNVSATSASFKHKSGGTTDGTGIRIDEGSTVKFTLTATLDPNTAGQYQLRVVGAGFGTSSGTPTGSSQTATPANDFRTSSVYIAQ